MQSKINQSLIFNDRFVHEVDIYLISMRGERSK